MKGQDFVLATSRNMLTMRVLFLFLLFAVSLQSCIPTESTEDAISSDASTETEETGEGENDYQAISLLGKKLFAPEMPAGELEKKQRELAKAKADFEAYPDSLECIVWYGRRLGYLSKYKDAIHVYTEGLRKFPDSYQLYRHRGHRYITVRQFDDAIRDLEKAAFYIRGVDTEIEEDGIPNLQNIPLSTAQFNIWYHLGLAYYLKGNFDKAISAYKKCMEVSTNDDLLVATTDWMYMTYRKLGNTQAAEKLLERIRPKMNIIENQSYHKRLLMYKGLLSPEKLLTLEDNGQPDHDVQVATQGYGVGNWYILNGQVDKGRKILEKVVNGNSWPAFGYIASEVELTNLQAML